MTMSGFSGWIILCLISLLRWANGGAANSRGFIHIRGDSQLQKLPTSLISQWNIWSLEGENLIPIESASSGEGWLQPTSFDSLYLPSDLPPPIIKPALGFAVSNGVARYLMPSLICSLETPSRVWRNRGLCSLPRAWAWIDLFAENTPPLRTLRYSCFGRTAGNLRFLEDQDGSAAWENLLPQEDISVRSIVEHVQAVLRTQQAINAELQTGFHFIDVPIPELRPILVPGLQLRSYLTDFAEPQRLLELEDGSQALDNEPCAELDMMMVQTGAGSESPFLPEVYRELYEEGNILQF